MRLENMFILQYTYKSMATKRWWSEQHEKIVQQGCFKTKRKHDWLGKAAERWDYQMCLKIAYVNVKILL